MKFKMENTTYHIAKFTELVLLLAEQVVLENHLNDVGLAVWNKAKSFFDYWLIHYYNRKCNLLHGKMRLRLERL